MASMTIAKCLGCAGSAPDTVHRPAGGANTTGVGSSDVVSTDIEHDDSGCPHRQSCENPVAVESGSSWTVTEKTHDCNHVPKTAHETEKKAVPMSMVDGHHCVLYAARPWNRCT